MGALSQLGIASGGASASDAETRQAIFRHYPRRIPYIRIGTVHRGRSHVHRAHDPVSGRTLELGSAATRILSRCDGSVSVARLIETEAERGGNREEAARLVLSCLDAAEMQGLIRPLSGAADGRIPPSRPGLLARTLKNPLFARFSLFRPDPLVDALAPLARAIFNPLGALLWLVIVGFGVWLAAANWNELVTYGEAHAFTPSNLLWTLLLFPVVKLLHELGHALACKRWGGQVRDFGIALLVFIPIPFVDCSDSAFFPRRSQRILVAGAGMMVEFVIAVGALTLWVASADPFLRLMAFNVVVMSTVTTIVFNANPLLRYDAYYILGDLIGIDNLAPRAQAVINTLARRTFLGDKRPWPETGRWRSALFVAYGTASFAYKCVIVMAVLVGIAPRFFVFGLILAVWGVATMVITPLYRQVRSIMSFAADDMSRRAGVAMRIGAPIVFLALLLCVPAPYVIVTPGSVQLPPDSIVRSGGNGVLAVLPLGNGAPVTEGTPLAVLEDDILDAEIASRQASLRAQQLRHAMLRTTDLVQAAQLEAEIGTMNAELAQQQANRLRLTATAPQTGQFNVTEGVRIGDFLREGDEIGLIASNGPDRIVISSLPQEDADLVRSRLQSIMVRTIGDDQHILPAHLLRNYPLFAPVAKGASSSLTGHFVFEIATSESALLYAQPVLVRFDLGWAPLAEQLWRSAGIWFNKIVMSRYIDEPV